MNFLKIHFGYARAHCARPRSLCTARAHLGSLLKHKKRIPVLTSGRFWWIFPKIGAPECHLTLTRNVPEMKFFKTSFRVRPRSLCTDRDIRTRNEFFKNSFRVRPRSLCTAALIVHGARASWIFAKAQKTNPSIDLRAILVDFPKNRGPRVPFNLNPKCTRNEVF